MADINLVARLIDRTGGGVSSVRRSMDRATGGVKGFNAAALGAKAGVAAIGVAAIKFGADAVQSFAKFDRKVREVASLTGDFSDKALGNIGQAATRIATETGQAAEKVLQGMYDAVSAGVASVDVEGFIGQAGKLAVAANTDISTSTDLLTSALNAYGLEASSAGDVSDTLFATVRAGKTTIRRN